MVAVANYPDAVAMVNALARRAVSSVELTEQLLARVAARDSVVRAWAYLDPAQALKAARAAGTQATGALKGLPIGIKDVILTQDMPTRYNCAMYADGLSGPDAACIAMLRKAGGIVLGKTATVELASIGAPAPTRNPHALTHTPGGSSSGSAAAVADGQVPLALGTQTGGSMLRPASFCGVWGFKPSWGLASMEGIKPFAPSLDTLGWFGRSAADIMLLLDVFDPSSVGLGVETLSGRQDLRGTRVGVWHMPGWENAGPNTQAAMAYAQDTLRASGAKIECITMPETLAPIADIHRTIMFSEGSRSFIREFQHDASALHPRIAEMVRTAGGYAREDVYAAYDAAALVRTTFDAIAQGYDAVLAPSTLDVALEGLATTGDMVFNAPFTLLHVPCVNIPMRSPHSNLPVGVTLAAPRGADRALLVFARLAEQALKTCHALCASL